MSTANAIAPPRFTNGQNLPDIEVVAADLVALVAGVNLASVNKVILALNLVASTLHQSYEDLLDTASLPTERADDSRMVDTEAAAKHVAAQPEAMEVEAQLHFVERMSRH